MEKQKTLVSVIVPTYNGAEYIADTLQSIINQDYENIEIILVDDVSTDDTVKISQAVLEKSGRKFSIIKRTTNGRQSASRNTGLKVANGEYVIFFDHDDLAEENYVSSLLKEAENKNADLVFCGFKEYDKKEKSYVLYKPVPFKTPLKSPKYCVRAWAEDKFFICCVWCFIFKKDFLLKNKILFPEQCYISEDLEFVLKSLALSSCTSFVNEMLYIYVRHSAQQTSYDVFYRRNYKIFKQERLSMWRAGRCAIRNTKDKYIKNYVLSFCIAREILKQCTLCAKADDLEYYNHTLVFLHHKKIRSIMLSTVKFIFREPELFFKSLMLVYFPNFYYWLRSKKGKSK